MSSGFTVNDHRRVLDAPATTPTQPDPWGLHPATDPVTPLLSEGLSPRTITGEGEARGRLICERCGAWQWFHGSSFREGRKALGALGWAYYKSDDFCPNCHPKDVPPKELRDALDAIPNRPSYQQPATTFHGISDAEAS